MFYEEKIINGILHYRTMPNAIWTPYTLERLSARHEETKQREAKYWGQLAEANRKLNDHEWVMVRRDRLLNMLPMKYMGTEAMIEVEEKRVLDYLTAPPEEEVEI